MPLAASVWDALGVVGGGFALSFIVAIALGISALTLLFVGSAVVVLERFARPTQRIGGVIGVTAVWSVVLGVLLLAGLRPELHVATWAEWLRELARTAAGIFVASALVQLLVGLLMRWITPRSLAVLTAVTLGAGYSLVVGGIDHLGYSLAPAVGAGLGVAFFAWRRRASNRGPGDGEVILRVLTGVLLLGVAIPAVLSTPQPAVSWAGSAMLGVLGAAVLGGLLPLAVAGFLQMRGSAEWFIATRYLFAKRRQTFISVITLICVAGVAAGVWLIITVLSVMNGFERTWRDEIIGNRAHFTVHSPFGPIEDYAGVLSIIDGSEGVTGASPYVDAEGMVRGQHGEIVGVRVRGIDPKRIGQVTDLPDDLQPGSEGALEALGTDGPGVNGADPGIIVGSQLAAALGLQLGEPIMLISPFGGPRTPLGPAPRLTRFRVVGVFQSSFFQYDEIYTYTSLAAAQDFRRLSDVVTGIEVRTTDFYRSQQVAQGVQERLDFQYFTRDWKEFFPAFFQALKTERVMMFVLLTMIMVVAAFAIVVTLVMMIMEKSSDIAILKTMGATDALVERIFAIEGTLIGLLGTVLGVIAGIAVTTQLSWVQEQIELLTGIDTLPAAVYQFSTLPWEIDVVQVAIVIGIAMILSLGGTLLPSRHGARLEPAEALRYE